MNDNLGRVEINGQTYILQEHPIRLDIGCGANPRPGYQGVDEFYERADIIKADMQDLSFLADNSVDAIFTSHALEHVGKYHIPLILQEWKRVIKPEGIIEIHVPDLYWCVTNWLKHGCPTDWHLDTIFGNQEHAGEYHRTGFTFKSMYEYLNQAGFTVVFAGYIDSHAQPTMVFRVVK